MVEINAEIEGVFAQIVVTQIDVCQGKLREFYLKICGGLTWRVGSKILLNKGKIIAAVLCVAR